MNVYKQKEITPKIYSKTEDGKIIINMEVKDDANFLSPYSEKDRPIISEEVASFLQTSTQTVKYNEEFLLNVSSTCIDEDEVVLYRQGVKNYYSEKYLSTKSKVKRSFIISYILGIMGILTLVLSQFIAYKFSSIIWTEAVNIVAWVLLWETVDILLFRTKELRLNQRRYLAFYKMKVEFLPLDKLK